MIVTVMYQLQNYSSLHGFLEGLTGFLPDCTSPPGFDSKTWIFFENIHYVKYYHCCYYNKNLYNFVELVMVKIS